MKNLILFLVLFFCSSFLEENFILELKARCDSYFAKAARTKLEMRFNQPKYAPGDTVFFKTSYVAASDLKPVKGTQIVHVCLFDQSGKKKITQSLSVTNGSASNKLVIPDDFGPGNYVFVAFTDWMKNFDNSLFFQKQMLIAGQHSFEKLSKDSLSVYAEGGSLVDGINNRVAIRYTGIKPKVKVAIKEADNEIISLLLIKDSVSVFSLKPKINGEYKAQLSTNAGLKEFLLPKVISSGISIFVEPVDRQIKLNLELSGSELANTPLYLLIFNNNGLAFHTPLDFSADRKKMVALPQNMPDGVAQTVIVDSKLNILCNRVIYFDGRQHPTVKVENLLANYASRQRVRLSVQPLGNEGYGVDGVFACQVINSDLFPSQNQGMDYLTFESDISNTFGLKKKDANPTTINNYLITQNCPWFDWKKITEKNQYTPLHRAQPYLTFSGKATYAKNGLAVKDSTLIMFFLENNLRGYETYADKGGHFSFPLILSIYSNDRFFYTASHKEKDADEIRLQIDDPDSLISFHAETWTATEAIDAYSVYSTQRKTINNSYSFFTNSRALRDSTFNPNKAMEIELNGADITLSLKDYLMMPTVEDVTKELLRGVEYRKIGGRHVVRVNTTGKVPNNHAGPLYVIDGQITKDPNYFLALKPADIVSIKVVKDSQKLFALGKLGANGVLIVSTKSRAVINEKNRIAFSGLLPPVSNYSRGDTGKNLPDLRACLYWSPTIQVSSVGPSEVQFTTSDDIGSFKIQVYGRTENGEPFFHEQPFEVRYPRN